MPLEVSLFFVGIKGFQALLISSKYALPGKYFNNRKVEGSRCCALVWPLNCMVFFFSNLELFIQNTPIARQASKNHHIIHSLHRHYQR